MSRVKRWHSDKLQHPMQKVVLYGPAHDMSLTSGGYYVNCEGKWMRTTVVVVPRFSRQACLETPVLELCGDDEGLDYAPTTPGADDPPDIEVTEDGLAIQQELEVQEELDDRQHLTHRLHGKQTVPRQRQDRQDSARLTHRLHGKQSDPRAIAVLRIGGECYQSLLQEEQGQDLHGEGLHDGGDLREGGLHDGGDLREGGLHDGGDLREGGLHDGGDLREGGLHDGGDLREGGLHDGRDLRGKGGLCDGRDLRGKGGLCDGRDLRGKGGLCDGRELHGMSGLRDEGDPGAHGKDNLSGQEKRQLGHGGAWNQQQMHNETAIALLQLKNLRKWEQEERAMMASTEDAEMIMDVQWQCETSGRSPLRTTTGRRRTLERRDRTRHVGSENHPD